jgi:hypothetical protein
VTYSGVAGRADVAEESSARVRSERLHSALLDDQAVYWLDDQGRVRSQIPEDLVVEVAAVCQNGPGPLEDRGATAADTVEANVLLLRPREGSAENARVRKCHSVNWSTQLIYICCSALSMSILTAVTPANCRGAWPAEPLLQVRRPHLLSRRSAEFRSALP